MSNTGGNYPTNLTMQIRPATGAATNLSLSNPYPGYLGNGSSFTFVHNSSSISSPPGNYNLDIVDVNGNFICSQPFTIAAPASPNLVCGTATISPTNPVTGQAYSFSYPISNTGTGNYTGTLYLRWRSGASGLTLQTYSGGITAGNAYTLSVSNSSLSSAPGTWYLSIEDANSTVICTKTVTVVAAPSCITWTGTPPTGEKLTAAEYLCSNGIIVSAQNGTDNTVNAITRELMAKITYLGIYKGTTPNSPAVNYPVPFTDMQGSTSQWLNAVKTLAYLQFNDDTTHFDRDFINFRPGDYLPRKYVVKALAEAFNIQKSTASPSPFSDVATTDPLYGYIKKFNDLGFVVGNTVACPSGTCFHPDDNITREDVFVILYRILIANNITRPTAAELNNPANYFIPSNTRMATMGKVPDIDQANFNHYQKTSFSIAGRGVSLDFTHTYNSFLTELPRGYFEQDDTPVIGIGQKFTPLGIGWTHTYNIYPKTRNSNFRISI